MSGAKIHSSIVVLVADHPWRSVLPRGEAKHVTQPIAFTSSLLCGPENRASVKQAQ